MRRSTLTERKEPSKSKEERARDTLPRQKRISQNFSLAACEGNQKWSVRSNFGIGPAENYSLADNNRWRAFPTGVLSSGAANDLRRRLSGVPADTFALLLGEFFDHHQSLRAAVLSAGGKNGIEQGYGSGVGRGEGSRFDRGDE